MGNLLLLLVAIIIAAIRIIKKGPLIYKPDWYSDKKPVLDPGEYPDATRENLGKFLRLTDKTNI